MDALQETAISTGEAANDATQAVMDSIRAFVVTGLTGAGYAPDAVERHADLTPMDRLAELKQAAMLGSGRLDFAAAPTGGALTPAAEKRQWVA
jgi:hypothetical protein